MKKNKTYCRLFALMLCCAVFLLQIQALAAAPTAVDFSKLTHKNSAITFSIADFTEHMTVGEGQSNTITLVKFVSLPDAPGASFSLNETAITAGQEITAPELDFVLFIPALDWTGTTSLQYQVKTDADYSNTATLTLDVTEPPANPLHAEGLSITTQINTPVEGQLSGISENQKPFVYQIVGAPIKGSVEVTNVNTGEFVYTPFTNQLGDDNFSFKISDGEFESEPALVLVNIEGAVPTPEPTGFFYSDMLGHWGEYSAIKLAEKNALIGEQIEDKFYFYPDKRMTRSDFLLLINSAVGYAKLPDPDPQFKFADDDQIPSWLKSPAYKAYAAGLISGSLQTDGTIKFEPFRAINRIETMVMLNNAMKPEAQSNIELDYADLDNIPVWSRPYVQNVEGYGLVRGYDNNTLQPFNTITKAEAAEMTYQLMKYIGKFPETLSKLDDLK